MKKDENKKIEKSRVDTDIDYIYSKKHNFSMEMFKKKNNKPVSDHRIAYLLLMSTEEVQKLYKQIIKRARQRFKVDL